MKKTVSLFAVTALAGSIQFVSAADITGTITLKGTPPPEVELPLSSDPNCGKLDVKATTHHYVVSDKGGLGNVFVSIKGMGGKSTGASAKPALLDQVGCEYTPHILAIQTGQKLLVRNSDPMMHNVHPTPAQDSGNKEANKAQMPKSTDLEFVFEKPEPFLRIKCDVHAWMFAYVSVVDHPYFSVSAKDGTFKIANVPPGKYTIEAVHRKTGTQTKEVEVKDGNVTLDLSFEPK